MKFRFIPVIDGKLLDEVLHFRYRIGCMELKALDPDAYPDERETDAYDPYADHFAVLDETDTVCATVRLIHDSPVGYPTENNFGIDPQKYTRERSAISELSRIFIDPRYRTMKDSKAIIQGLMRECIYGKLLHYGITCCYGTLEPAFAKLLNIFKVPYTLVGEGGLFYGAMRHPAIMYRSEFERLNPDLLAKEKKA